MEGNNVFFFNLMFFNVSISYKNEFMFGTSRIFEFLFIYLFIFIYSFFLSFDANKEDLLNITHCIISLLLLGGNFTYFNLTCH